MVHIHHVLWYFVIHHCLRWCKCLMQDSEKINYHILLYSAISHQEHADTTPHSRMLLRDSSSGSEELLF